MALFKVGDTDISEDAPSLFKIKAVGVQKRPPSPNDLLVKSRPRATREMVKSTIVLDGGAPDPASSLHRHGRAMLFHEDKASKNRLKDPETFESRHKRAVTANPACFRRVKGTMAGFVEKAVKNKGIIPMQVGHIRLSPLGDALPGAVTSAKSAHHRDLQTMFLSGKLTRELAGAGATSAVESGTAATGMSWDPLQDSSPRESGYARDPWLNADTHGMYDHVRVHTTPGRARSSTGALKSSSTVPNIRLPGSRGRASRSTMRGTRSLRTTGGQQQRSTTEFKGTAGRPPKTAAKIIKAQRVAHVARGLMQTRSTCRLSPRATRDLGAGFFEKGTWNELGLRGKPVTWAAIKELVQLEGFGVDAEQKRARSGSGYAESEQGFGSFVDALMGKQEDHDGGAGASGEEVFEPTPLLSPNPAMVDSLTMLANSGEIPLTVADGSPELRGPVTAQGSGWNGAPSRSVYWRNAGARNEESEYMMSELARFEKTHNLHAAKHLTCKELRSKIKYAPGVMEKLGLTSDALEKAGKQELLSIFSHVDPNKKKKAKKAGLLATSPAPSRAIATPAPRPGAVLPGRGASSVHGSVASLDRPSVASRHSLSESKAGESKAGESVPSESKAGESKMGETRGHYRFRTSGPTDPEGRTEKLTPRSCATLSSYFQA